MLEAGAALPEDHGTSALVAIDSERRACSLTTTVNTPFGSKVFSPSTGVLLNNQMDDFSTPGQPNFFGLVPSEPNFIAPGKRPLSSMSPTIVTQGGALRMAVGASGGPKIITAVTQVVLNALFNGDELQQAVAAPRVHSQVSARAVRCCCAREGGGCGSGGTALWVHARARGGGDGALHCGCGVAMTIPGVATSRRRLL